MFDNLIKNAVDFVPINTGIIKIGCIKENKKHIFFVKDNGTGIKKENQKQLFTKFTPIDSTVTRKYGGSGLGLAICKGIIKGLDGKIWVESAFGSGTTFYFSIPEKKT